MINLEEGLTVLSCFDGMGCGRIALERAGIKVKAYFASEIDKPAMKVAKHNWPDIIHIGDVTKVKVKSLSLSEVYSYICKYDTNLQSEFSEQEMLYWLNQKFVISANIRAQIPDERPKVQKSPVVQCFEEIRFYKRDVGGFIKTRNIGRSRNGRDKSDSSKPYKLQYSSRRECDGLYAGDTTKDIRWSERKTKKQAVQKSNIADFNSEVYMPKGTSNNIPKNQGGYVATGNKEQIFGRQEEDRYDQSKREKESNPTDQTFSDVSDFIRYLQAKNETHNLANFDEYILCLHKKAQVTLVEHENGVSFFIGCVDLTIGGSPCQGFSFAGKQLNFEDPRSKLFFEFVRLRRESACEYFMLENVMMKQEYQDVISSYLKVKPVFINSDLVSAHDRKRLYWSNIIFNNLPLDKGLKLIDIADLLDKTFSNIKTQERPRSLRNFRKLNQNLFA